MHIMNEKNNTNNIFVDTNCLISYIADKYKIIKDNNKNMAALHYLFQQEGKRLYISSLSVAQLTAKLQRHIGVKQMTNEIKNLMHKFTILEFSAKDIETAIEEDNQLRDIENTYQYCIARKAKCYYIMTNNLKDFRNKYSIEAFPPQQVRRVIFG